MKISNFVKNKKFYIELPFFVLFLFLFFPLNSYASYTFQYTVYSAPDIAAQAFNSMQLWFSDPNWKYLLISIFGFSILVGALTNYARSVATGKGNVIFSVIFPAIFGAAVYMTFFSNATSQPVYLVNGFTGNALVLPNGQTIVNLPLGVAVTVDVLGDIESELYNALQESSNSVTGTPIGSSWIGLSMLNKMVTGGPAFANNDYLSQNLRQYTIDCVSFAIANAANNNGKGIPISDLLSVGGTAGSSSVTNWTNVLSKAANPAVYTTYYSSSGASSVTCQDDWTQNLYPVLSNPATGPTADALNSFMQSTGFSGQYANTGAGIVNSIFNYITNGQVSSTSGYNLLQNFLIAQNVRDVVLQGNNQAFTTQLNYSTIPSSVGTFQSLNYYLPVLKSLMLAVIAGVTGLLVILLPTPWFTRVLETIFGLWLWYALWMVSDALISRISLDVVQNALNTFGTNGYGLLAVYQSSSELPKILGMIGGFRALGMGIATVLAGVITKSSAALVGEMVVGHLQGTASISGAKAGVATGTPTGEAETASQMESATPSLIMSNMHKFSAMTSAGLNTRSMGFGKGLGLGSAGEAERFGNEQAQILMSQTRGKWIGYGGNTQEMENIATKQTHATIGQIKGMENIANMNGKSIEQLAEYAQEVSSAGAMGNYNAYNGDMQKAQEVSAMNTLQNIRQNKGFVELMKAGHMLPSNYNSLSEPEKIKALAHGMTELGSGAQNVYLTAQQAQGIFHNKNMVAGTYSVGFDKNGDAVQVVGKGGADMFQVTPHGVVKMDSTIGKGNTVQSPVMTATTFGNRTDEYDKYKSIHLGTDKEGNNTSIGNTSLYNRSVNNDSENNVSRNNQSIGNVSDNNYSEGNTNQGGFSVGGLSWALANPNTKAAQKIFSEYTKLAHRNPAAAKEDLTTATLAVTGLKKPVTKQNALDKKTEFSSTEKFVLSAVPIAAEIAGGFAGSLIEPGGGTVAGAAGGLAVSEVLKKALELQFSRSYTNSTAGSTHTSSAETLDVAKADMYKTLSGDPNQNLQKSLGIIKTLNSTNQKYTNESNQAPTIIGGTTKVNTIDSNTTNTASPNIINNPIL